MKYRKYIIMFAVACLLIPHILMAGHYSNARSLAMAQSYTSLARNYQAIGVNPANLAYNDNNNYAVEIFSVGAELANNSFSFSDYNKYNGSHLTSADKQDILDKIPESGLEGSLESGVSALNFSYGQFAFGVTGNGNGQVNLDKKLVELMFNGNAVGDSINITDAFGTGVAHVDFNLSYGRKLLKTNWGVVNGGINVKYIYGVSYANVENAEGYLVTSGTGLNSEGSAQLKTSMGGSGLGIDIGFSANYKNSYDISLAVTNLISSINWSKDNKLNTYLFTVDNLSLENSDDDSTATSEEIEEEISDFTSSLAPQLALGISTQFNSYLVSFDYKQGFKNLGMVSTTPEISLGCEATYLKSIPVRAGLSVGGAESSSFALGFGINFQPFYFDVAYVTTGSLIPFGGRGKGLAVSSGLVF